MTDPNLTEPAARPSTAVSEVRPGLVTAGFVVVLAAAAVNAGIGVLVLLQLPVAARAVPARAEPAVALLLVVAAFAFVYAATLVVLAWLLRSGRPWGRTALTVASLFSLVALLVPTVPALVVIVLLAAAAVLLHRPAVTVWVRSLRGVGRA